MKDKERERKGMIGGRSEGEKKGRNRMWGETKGQREGEK